jgi:hypothetical protein
VAVSKKIVNAPIVVFLGAGASKPLGLMLMHEFVSSLRNVQVRHKDLFDEICKQKQDLEYLFQQLEELETKEYLNFTPPSPIALGGLRGDEVTGPDLKRAAQALNSWLRQRVFQHYRTVPEKQNLPVLSNILQGLLNQVEQLVVFTTNYDPAVESLCAPDLLNCSLIDGFRNDESRREYVWDRGVFDDSSLPPGSLVLFKLHGSTDWIKSGNRIVRSAPIFEGSDTLHKNVMIFPATRKIASEDPYFTSYDYLGRCLANAKICLVIGYSFRDYDALTRFKASKIENPKLKISILDPKADEHVQFLSDNGIQAMAIPATIGVRDADYLPLIGAATFITF